MAEVKSIFQQMATVLNVLCPCCNVQRREVVFCHLFLNFIFKVLFFIGKINIFESYKYNLFIKRKNLF